MLSKPSCVVEGDASIWTLSKGTGTSDDVNGVAPAEKGTLGLLVPFNVTGLVLLPNEAMNEPEKNRLLRDEFEVIDNTSAAAPDRPPNGGADHDDDLTFHTATEDAGDVK